MQKEDIRCGQCGRKMAEGQYVDLRIKCPRCGAFNHLRASSPALERQRAPQPGENYGRKSDRSVAGRQEAPG